MRWSLRGGASLVLIAVAGCGGGTGDTGAPGEARKVFVVPHVLESSGRITRVAAGDVDGDGVLDLVVLDASTSSVSVLRSTGLRESPTFPSLGNHPRRLARGARAYGGSSHVFVWDSAADLCVADLDGDGAPDLVVAGGSAGQVGVWPGAPSSSHGTRYHQWRWASIVDVGGSADRVAVGDVNGDGVPDIVCLDESTGQVKILHQDPAARRMFTVDASPPVVTLCRGLVLADVDRDGRADLVTNQPHLDGVVVLSSSTAAGWTVRESPTGKATGRAFAVGDVDGDGWVDIVVLEEGGAGVVCLHQRPAEPGVFDPTSSPLGITVNEEGVGCAQISIDEPGTGRAGIAIDEEGVQATDLAIGHPGLLGRGRCVSQAGLALADVDRDGALDLLCSPAPDATDPSPIVVFGIRKSPTRFFGFERLSPGLRESPSRPSMGRLCAVGDLDCDGHVDLITGDPDFDLLAVDYLEDAVPASARAFSERLRVTPTSQTTGRFADLDRDGLPDIVCATAGGLEIRWQDAAAPGTFLAPLVLGPAQSFVDVAVGDVNGDGCPDLVAATSNACAAILRDPKGPRTFLPAVQFPPDAGRLFRALALGDLDGDGVLDCVAIRESPSKASLSRGLGQGFFDVFTELDAAVADPLGVAVGDVNGDGRLDIVVCGSGECAVVAQDPSGPLKWMAPEPIARQGGVRVAVGDVNGDGRCDVVTSGDGGVLVGLQSALEPGRFLTAYALSSQACGGLCLTDLDRDGVLDACFVERATGTLVGTTGDPDFDLLRVLSHGGLPAGNFAGGVFVAAGDLDGDGRADLLASCPSDPAGATSTLVVVSQGP